jgi:hypothetical protein
MKGDEERIAQDSTAEYSTLKLDIPMCGERTSALIVLVPLSPG